MEEEEEEDEENGLPVQLGNDNVLVTVGIFGTMTINKAFYVSSRVIIDFFDRNNLMIWRSKSRK